MVLQLLGLIIASLVLVHVLYLFWSSVREHRGTVRILELALTEATESARVKWEDTERRKKQTELSWVGQRKFEVQRKVFESEDRSICSFYLLPTRPFSISTTCSQTCSTSERM